MSDVQTQAVSGEVKEKVKKSGPAVAECWHFCPSHAAMYPLWSRMTDADQLEVGVLWNHPVNDLAKLDDYEKICPSCKQGASC